MASSDRINRTSRDVVRIALYRLELAIIPHVQTDRELRRRLRRLEELRSGLLVADQLTLVREFDAVALPELAS